MDMNMVSWTIVTWAATKIPKIPWFGNQDCPLFLTREMCRTLYSPSNFMSINVMSWVILLNHIIIVQSKTHVHVLPQNKKKPIFMFWCRSWIWNWHQVDITVFLMSKFWRNLTKNRKISWVYTRKRKSKNFSISLSINSKISPGKKLRLIQEQLFTTNLLQRTPL
jgi:hypothetical protein